MKTVDFRETILNLVKNKELHGYEIYKKLHHDNVKVDISRIYKTLNGMEKEKLLESRWDKSHLGPKRKVYRLGTKGKSELDKILSDAIGVVHDFYKDYLLNLPPQVSVFENMYKIIAHGLEVQGNVAYITLEYSSVHKMLLNTIRTNTPASKIYLVKPSSVELETRHNSLNVFDGNYTNIPLKDNHLDLMVVVKFPGKKFLEKAMAEWRRVMTKNGRVAIITPSILVEKNKDPLSIGSFVEKYEHENIEGSRHLEKESILELLKNYFHTVEEKKIVHLTIFLASA